MKPEYTDQEILCELREANEKTEGILTGSDVEEHCSFSSTTCYNHFESFSEAKRQAGIAVGNAKDRSDQEYLIELERVAEELGRTPTIKDMDEHSDFSVQPYQTRWGSWSGALNAVGMQPRNRSAVSEGELLDELQRLAEELERTPSVTDVNQHSEFSESTYMKRFGGITTARVEAGLDEEIDRTERVKFTCDWCGETEEKKPSEAKRREYCSSTCANRAVSGVTDEELLERLRGLAEELGRAPTGREFNQQTEYWHCSLGYRFGSYSQAIREIGYEPKCAKDHSREDLIELIERMSKQLGRAPKTTDLSDFKGPKTAYVFVTEFGSWAEALEKAGVEAMSIQLSKIPKDELIDEYRELADELGHPPSYTEVNDLARYSPAAYENTFGTFLEAKEKAGFEPVATDNQPRGKDHYAWKGGTKPRYGKSWREQREKAIQRDNHTCQSCGVTTDEHRQDVGTDLHVHHITPWDEFESHEERNKLSNLITLCARCHRTWENLPVKPQVAAQ